MSTPTPDELDLEFGPDAITIEDEAVAPSWKLMDSALYISCRARATDSSLPLAERLGYLIERALRIRDAHAGELDEEAAKPRLATVWLAAEGVAWDELGGQHQLRPETGEFGMILYFAIFGAEREIYAPTLAALRRMGNHWDNRRLDELVRLCSLEED